MNTCHPFRPPSSIHCLNSQTRQSFELPKRPVTVESLIPPNNTVSVRIPTVFHTINMETKLSDTAPATAPASSEAFIYFSELPIELRMKIFRHAILPRTVAFILTKSNPQLRALKGPQPALLHVNSESRHEALRTYQTLDLDAYFQPHLYFNFDMDTLYFSNWYELEFFLLHAKRNVTRQVKSLNLSAKAICTRGPVSNFFHQLAVDIFYAFQYLENFTVLVRRMVVGAFPLWIASSITLSE